MWHVFKKRDGEAVLAGFLELKAGGISFWIGGKDRSDGVGMFVAEKWVDSVVNVERRSERVLILKMVLDNSLLNFLTVYAPHSGKPEEEKEIFWNELFHLMSCIPQNEMVVLAGDMNGYVGSNNVGYDGMHSGYRFGARNADGSRILEFANGLNLVICNTLFMKQESKLVTYIAGSAKSTVNYIMVRRGDKVKVRSVKVIPNKKCVPKHTLLVMDMRFNTTKRRHKKFEPRVRVWKFKKEQTFEEYKSMVRDKVEEEEWKHLDVNEHWHEMKR